MCNVTTLRFWGTSPPSGPTFRPTNCVRRYRGLRRNALHVSREIRTWSAEEIRVFRSRINRPWIDRSILIRSICRQPVYINTSSYACNFRRSFFLLFLYIVPDKNLRTNRIFEFRRTVETNAVGLKPGKVYADDVVPEKKLLFVSKVSTNIVSKIAIIVRE